MNNVGPKQFVPFSIYVWANSLAKTMSMFNIDPLDAQHLVNL